MLRRISLNTSTRGAKSSKRGEVSKSEIKHNGGELNQMKKSEVLGEKFEKFSNEKGRCVVCDERVYENDDHLVASEGYCHKDCIFQQGETSATA